MMKKLRSISKRLLNNWKTFSALLIVSFALFAYLTPSGRSVHHKYSINNAEVLLEEVSTRDKLEKGLMYRKHLEKNHGMLFIFPKTMSISMWMKNTFIPLDIIFLDENFKVIKVHRNAIPHDTSSLIKSDNTKYVMELNAGEAALHNIKIGDKLTNS